MDISARLYGEKVFAFLESLKRLESPEAVADALLPMVRSIGLEYFLVGTQPILGESFDDVVLINRLPEEWAKQYARNRYAETDPVVRQMKCSWKPFEWREALYDAQREPEAAKIMDRRREFGFAEGFVIPVHTQKGFAGFVSMSGSRLELSSRSRPAMHLVALYAFHHISSLRKLTRPAATRLTPREREVLTWVASGKSAWEIGEILNIAKRTVDEHVQSSFQKLGAVSRPHAVAIAIRDGLINL